MESPLSSAKRHGQENDEEMSQPQKTGATANFKQQNFIFPSTFLPLLQWQRTRQTIQVMVANTLRKMKTYYKLQNNNENYAF